VQFEKGNIYHIYNRGNNRGKVFFKRDNYLFFMKKMKAYITPHAYVLAWCLMPNHFHIMALIKDDYPGADTMTYSHRISLPNTLNNSIAILLRSYARAINIQEERSGSLFQSHTKAECVNGHKGITPSFIVKEGITIFKPQLLESIYPAICFNYIHQNPVKAKLVSKDWKWEYSSAMVYAGRKDPDLVRIDLAKEIGLF